jgi:phosphoribosylanthranilate isomerase
VRSANFRYRLDVRVKICGITNIPDALAAVDAGADALGFMFVPASPRTLKLETAASIIRELPPFVSRVGVMVDPSPQFVEDALRKCGLSAVQLHGNESPEFCSTVAGIVIKAFRVSDRESLAGIRGYATGAWLLDSYVADKMGGTGIRFNWDLALEVKQWGRPVILAGGLTPANVADAVQQVQPYGVDVSSGVESVPGKKDPIKVRDFIAAAKQAGRKPV